jgi:hypothetical protein
MENCSPALFTGGSMVLDGDGNFELSVLYEDEDGQDGFQDHGQFHRQGDTDLSFDSQAWGGRFDGEIEGDLVVLLLRLLCQRRGGHRSRVREVERGRRPAAPFTRCCRPRLARLCSARFS